MRNFRSLDADKVIETIAALQRRIEERFPNAGLRGVCGELLTIARESSQRAQAIGRTNTPLRLLVFAFLVGSLWVLAWILSLIDFTRTGADSVYSVLQGIEAAANLTVLMGAALSFCFASRSASSDGVPCGHCTNCAPSSMSSICISSPRIRVAR
jgi:hypothetical protein